jgi:rSAM/selenodomain-associated transferase 2
VAGSSRRLVLNREAPIGEACAVDAEAGAGLARAMLQAVAAHTTDAGTVEWAAMPASTGFARAESAAARLRDVDPGRFRSRDERLAFWINVYNALALHGVVRLGLRTSVWEVWNFFGRVSYEIGGHVLSLDDIEHGILRGNRRRALPPWPPFGPRDPRRGLAIDPVDPRIHFALNCAAASCPPVGVYRAEVIDAQLDVAARNVVNQEVALDGRGRVVCPRILKWYGGDFGGPARLGEFLARHLDDGPVKAALAAGASPCRTWRAYSWALPATPQAPATPGRASRVSIVIPSRNDAAALGRTLDHLARSVAGVGEIVVAASGAREETERAVGGRARLLWPDGSTRAQLMNAGAAAATGDVLFFLHADSFPPPDAIALIGGALSDPRAVGGAFEHLFAEPVWSLRAITWINRIRYRLTHNYYGDQGIFVRAAAFRAAGGYPDVALMEDLMLSQRLRRRGRYRLVTTPLVTSGRRFLARGPWRTFFFIVWLLFLHTLRRDTQRYAERWRGPAGSVPGSVWPAPTS